MRSKDRGVPEALERALRRLGEEVDPAAIDRIWLFPPLVRGRRERGVMAVSCFAEADRRRLLTLAWKAEESGKGVAFESVLQEEGEAPRERIPRVIDGVVRRADAALGAPRSVEVGGDPGVFEELLQSLGLVHPNDPRPSLA